MTSGDQAEKFMAPEWTGADVRAGKRVGRHVIFNRRRRRDIDVTLGTGWILVVKVGVFINVLYWIGMTFI